MCNVRRGILRGAMGHGPRNPQMFNIFKIYDNLYNIIIRLCTGYDYVLVTLFIYMCLADK